MEEFHILGYGVIQRKNTAKENALHPLTKRNQKHLSVQTLQVNQQDNKISNVNSEIDSLPVFTGVRVKALLTKNI